MTKTVNLKPPPSADDGHSLQRVFIGNCSGLKRRPDPARAGLGLLPKCRNEGMVCCFCLCLCGKSILINHSFSSYGRVWRRLFMLYFLSLGPWISVNSAMSQISLSRLKPFKGKCSLDFKHQEGAKS